jgi:hypothetical protein
LLWTGIEQFLNYEPPLERIHVVVVKGEKKKDSKMLNCRIKIEKKKKEQSV